jgi:ATF/CREB family transcription factor
MSSPPEAREGSNKRQKTSMPSMDEDDSDMDDMDMERGPDNKKMTDEEKRKNFLERNRYVSRKGS